MSHRMIIKIRKDTNHMRTKTTALIIFILLLIPSLLHSLEDDPSSDIIILPMLRIWGLDLHIGFPSPLFTGDTVTTFWLETGFGYEWTGFFRNPDGEPYDGSTPGFDPENSPYYTRLSFQLNAGVEQGLLWNQELHTNLCSLFLFYKLRYEDYIENENSSSPQLIFSGDYPDKQGILQNSLLLGITLDSIKKDHHNIWSGIECEASVELAPEFLANTVFGLADFIRYNVSFRAFIPLFDIEPNTETNVLSVYCGFFFTIDYLSGDYIPINALQTIGGTRPKPGLGYTVRGIEARRFDSPFKAAGNFDLRINLPEIGNGIIQPGCIFYVDAGYYHFIDFDAHEFIYTTGGGLSFSLFNIVTICVYTQVLLNESLVRGGNFIPCALELSYHF
jgi:hypothetical protein